MKQSCEPRDQCGAHDSPPVLMMWRKRSGSSASNVTSGMGPGRPVGSAGHAARGASPSSTYTEQLSELSQQFKPIQNSHSPDKGTERAR